MIKGFEQIQTEAEVRRVVQAGTEEEQIALAAELLGRSEDPMVFIVTGGGLRALLS